MNISGVIVTVVGTGIGIAIGVAAYNGIVEIPGIDAKPAPPYRPVQDEFVIDIGNRIETITEVDPNAGLTPQQIADRDFINRQESYLRTHPQDEKRVLFYGGELVKRRYYQRAIDLYQDQLNKDPDNPNYLYGLGSAFEKSATWKQAISLYERTLQAKNNHFQAMNNLAWVLATAPDGSIRNGRRAVQLAKQALQQAGKMTGSVADTLAAAHAENGNFDAAIELQQWVIEKAPAHRQTELLDRLDMYRNQQPYRVTPDVKPTADIPPQS